MGPGEVPAGEAGEGVAGQARGGEKQGPQQGDQSTILYCYYIVYVDSIALSWLMDMCSFQPKVLHKENLFLRASFSMNRKGSISRIALTLESFR